MTRPHNRQRRAAPESKLLLVLGAIVVAVCLAHPIQAQTNADPTLVLVVSHSTPLKGITTRELRAIYLRDTKNWADGSTILPLNLKAGTPERQRFDQAVLNMDAAAIGRFWIDRRIRGGSRAPKALASSALIQRVVGARPGAIGYVRADQLTEEVKPLTLDGRVHTEPGYALAAPSP